MADTSQVVLAARYYSHLVFGNRIVQERYHVVVVTMLGWLLRLQLRPLVEPVFRFARLQPVITAAGAAVVGGLGMATLHESHGGNDLRTTALDLGVCLVLAAASVIAATLLEIFFDVLQRSKWLSLQHWLGTVMLFMPTSLPVVSLVWTMVREALVWALRILGAYILLEEGGLIRHTMQCVKQDGAPGCVDDTDVSLAAAAPGGGG
eukprot:GHVU01112244.1.p2 GENE.GHVU01112244.1~~GHVU01112244.1.p2  ORF type:complete len:242 (-),score=29.91 GHVU01112244.1:625-1242(-)